MAKKSKNMKNHESMSFRHSKHIEKTCLASGWWHSKGSELMKEDASLIIQLKQLFMTLLRFELNLTNILKYFKPKKTSLSPMIF